MALTAQITRFTNANGTEKWHAGLTRHTFSAMTSFLSGAGDFWRGVARCEWLFPDGQTKVGPNVQWRPNASGSGNVRLRVYDGLGNFADAFYAVTVAAAPTFTFTKFVRSDGNDGNSGDVNSAGGAYLTLNKAFNTWRNQGSPPPVFGHILVNPADTPAWTGTFPSDPDWGPLLVTLATAGAHAVFQGTDDQEVNLGSTGHDNSTIMSNPIVLDLVEVSWATPQDPGGVSHRGQIGTTHVLSSFCNGKVHNARLNVQASGFVAENVVVEFSGDVGFGFSSGAGFSVLEACTAKGNGTSSTFDHQGYISGGDSNGFNDDLFDGTGSAGAFSGLKVDGTQRAAVTRCTSKNCDNGIDSSGNPPDPGTHTNSDLVVQDHVFDGCVLKGFWLNDVNRVSYRNCRNVNGGMSDTVVMERGYNNTDTAGAGNRGPQNVDIIGCSFNLFTGKFVNFTSFDSVSGVGLWQAWTIQNSIVVKSGNGPFFSVQKLADLAQLTHSNCCYFRSGGTDGSGNFAVVLSGPGSGTYNFAQWKAAVADVTSVFVDPMFVSATDLRPQNPLVLGVGLSIGAIGFDAVGTVRPVGFFDLGALQVTTGGAINPPSAGGGVEALPMRPAGRGVGRVRTVREATFVGGGRPT